MRYRYPAKDYLVLFESEGSSFSIRIHRGDCYLALMQIEPYDNGMLEEQFKHALRLLKDALHREIRFNRTPDGIHLYQGDENGAFKMKSLPTPRETP